MKTLLRWLTFAVLLLTTTQGGVAEGWGWNPFAKKDKGQVPTRSVSATQSTLIDGKKLSSPVSNQRRYVSTSAVGSSQPGVAKKAMSGAVDMITLKPLRNKLASPPASNWSSKPPAKARPPKKDGKPSFLGSLFKPAQPKPPQTVTEWINQPRPKF